MFAGTVVVALNVDAAPTPLITNWRQEQYRHSFSQTCLALTCLNTLLNENSFLSFSPPRQGRKGALHLAMFVPFVSSKKLYPRKGGGGKGRGSSGSTKSSSGTTSVSQHKTGYSGTKTKSKTKKTKYKNSASSSNPTAPQLIAAGRLFAGRKEGGGTRSGIYGTSTYGSGYPTTYAPATQVGTSGLGFPYYFWPIAWAGVGYSVYDSRYAPEYGEPTNSSRPGGPLVFATYPSTGSKAGTFRILADNGTILELIESISQNCSSVLPSDSIQPTPVAYTAPPPHPDQAIQYFRASTIVLSFDAFNASSSNPPANFVPSFDTVDTKILDCLNYTIGESAPLDDGALGLNASSSLLLIVVGLVTVMMNMI